MTAHHRPVLAARRVVALAAVVALTTTGCSTLLGGGTASDGSDLTEVKRRIVELQEQAAVAEVELDRLRREVAELRSARGYVSPTSTAPSEVSSAGEARQGTDDRPYPEARSSGGIEVSDIEAPRPVRSATVPSVGAAEPPPPVAMPESESVPESVTAAPASQPPVAAATVVSAEIPPAAQALYDEGYTLFHQGRYLDSEAVFQRFLASYGALELTDNALYWIGECRYARGDFEGALASFQETVARFPDGNKVPAALFKSGRCLESLGDFAGARKAYDEVATRFPNDAVAGVARERFAQIR